MHVIFRESHGLEETETPTDLRQAPADLVVLSFSDSDLQAFAAGWHRAREQGTPLPSLRLASLAALRHPVSVDTYVEQTLADAKAILIRVIGGMPYWDYGLAQVRALAESRGTTLAVLPGDGRPDARLEAISTVPHATLARLDALVSEGGAVAGQAALAQLALSAGLYAGPVDGIRTIPAWGCWTPEYGARGGAVDADAAAGLAPEGAIARPSMLECRASCHAECLGAPGRPLVAIVFYRAYLAAADTAPIEHLMRAFRDRGHSALGLFVPSLKDPAAAHWLRGRIATLSPAAIVNATAFSGKGADGSSPLDAAGVPVLQVALATSTGSAWKNAARGLSPADLAMHVVLPEVDGRIFAGVASFKEPGDWDADLQARLVAHRPDANRIAAIADRTAAWVALAAKARSDVSLAIVLSTYPGKTWRMAHAVGLDAFASVEAIMDDLDAAGYTIESGGGLETALARGSISWSVMEYKAALSELPDRLVADLEAAWGDPEDDAAVRDDAFHFRAVRRGRAVIALQPERGNADRRDEEYHDLSRVPRHEYVAFHLWLRKVACIDALVHVGAHGTLEWLPGKSVALSNQCWPEVLAGPLPVMYPFIVNDPGEAAQAKRRIGAVTLGHLPPPVGLSETPRNLFRLEALLDEFSNADGLDPRRRERLQDDIQAEAQTIGLDSALGLNRTEGAAEAIMRIDRFVCDVKDSQFGDGLHVWGRESAWEGSDSATGRTSMHPLHRPDVAASVKAEREALLDALSGRRIDAGPAGSPYRGRTDVLPTGRNLFATDPRAVPTRAAHAQGVRLAREFVRRHLQEQGDYPKGLVVDLWGSATMRTAGEEFAMALHLLGVRPTWDEGSERVSGIEVLPIAELEWPRLDVTLRVSGLFRDVFPTLSALYSQAIRALAAREEATDWNPFAGAEPGSRVYGPEPGSFGLGMERLREDFTEEARRDAGAAWLAASAWAMDGDRAIMDPDGLAAQVAGADAFVHLQDLPETDLLLAADYAAHEAGFAAAKAVTGGRNAALYHLDNTDPARPRARTLTEEVARVVHARAVQPGWLAGMTRHGFQGAAEIAATLDHMAAFANLANVVDSRLFDAYYDATLGDASVTEFMLTANPEALSAMRKRFNALHRSGLWRTRRNSIRVGLEAAE
ncbi:MAG: cobaltochelatase subunit CobN [Boseongicola sp.]|nr:cobaltochelatase subunit CobN [Boseongicola sp.]